MYFVLSTVYDLVLLLLDLLLLAGRILSIIISLALLTDRPYVLLRIPPLLPVLIPLLLLCVLTTTTTQPATITATTTAVTVTTAMATYHDYY